MKFNEDHLQEAFLLKQIPEWICPTCSKGKLQLKNDFIINELKSSKDDADHVDWDPEWVREKFYGDLICSNKACEEKITIAGRIQVEPEYEYDEGYSSAAVVSWSSMYYPEYFYPYLKLFELPEEFPYELEDPIENVFKLFWINKSACANAVRTMIEEILTDQKIRKTTMSRQKKRVSLNLHQRIEKFKIENPTVAEFFLAIKWIGNHGSHSEDILHEDLLDSIKFLHVSIEKLYSKEEKHLMSKAKEINKKKRPIN